MLTIHVGERIQCQGDFPNDKIRWGTTTDVGDAEIKMRDDEGVERTYEPRQVVSVSRDGYQWSARQASV